MPAGDSPDTVLAVDDLRVAFRPRGAVVHAVNGLGFRLRRGELLGIVGESGSGKSASMLALMRLLPASAEVSGTARLNGADLLGMSRRDLDRVRGVRIGYVFQDPMTSLNPVLTVGYQLMEPLRRHLGLSWRDARLRAVELLRRVGLPAPERRLADFPHQLSGGMRQRVMIAIALACHPELLIADEPTTALDVTVQAQILDLVRELRREMGMSIVWITHDLAVIAGLADRVLILYAGQIVESGTVRQIFRQPRHPYTRALLRTLPSTGTAARDRLDSIPGQPPLLREAPRSCPFAPRCAHAHDRCHRSNPPLMQADDGQFVACWLVGEAVSAHA